MPDALIHPTPQQLADFGLGKLPERDAATVVAHLDTCPACRKAVAAVPPDSFLNKVRAVRSDGSSCPPGLARPGQVPSITGTPSPLAACPDLPPELARHPRYLILRELGRGGMGIVYQARHKEMDRQVVIKVINRSLLDRPESLERFRREIRAAAQLSHPNIVTAYDAEQAGESHMLVMEFVPGHSLAEVLKKKGPLPAAFACNFARQVALGLQHAYERGTVHRDIKPQNLMLTPKGQIKILDFGLAKLVREEGKNTGLTSDNAYLGTPDYCAPEQATDARKADIRADLYSLGCTLYYLLSARPPFREDTLVKVILAHQQKQPQPLPELRPDVPPNLWQVVARLLAKEPAKRYEKPIEVAQALAPFIKSGMKQEAKGGAALVQSTGSPAKGTVFELETSEDKKIPQDLPAKATPMEVTAKKEASLFADLGVNASLKRTPGTKRNRRKGCVLTVAVSVSLALLLITGTIITFDPHQLSSRDKREAMATKGGNDGEQAPPAPPAPVRPKLTLPADASIDDLREALKHPDPEIQEMAAARLADLGPKAEPAKYALAETLTNAKTRTSVRRNAALALAHIGAKAKPIAPALAQAINASEPLEVRQFAAEALAQMNYPANEAAIPAILDALENDPDADVRLRCTFALFKMDQPKLKDSGAEKLLTKLLDERSGGKMALIRYSAARKLAHVLGNRAPDKTVDGLLEMLNDKTLVVYNSTDVKVVGGHSKLQENLGGDARYMAAQALSWLGKKASDRKDVVDALKAAAEDANSKLRETATAALKDLGIP